jgi:hypothetical protein
MGRDAKRCRCLKHFEVTIVMIALKINVTKAALSVMSCHIRCATIACIEFTTVLSLSENQHYLKIDNDDIIEYNY